MAGETALPSSPTNIIKSNFDPAAIQMPTA